MQEYLLPPIEGQKPPEHKLKLIKLEENEVPFDMGGLEKEAFSHFTSWEIYITKSNEKYGYAHKIGIKENVMNENGNLALILYSFHIPLSFSKKKLEDDIIGGQREEIKKIMCVTAQLMAEKHPIIYSIFPNTPEYLLKDFLIFLSTE